MPRTVRRADRTQEVLWRRQPDLTVVMENIHDPHNVSAVFRSADAAGVLRVHLLYTAEKFPRIGAKSSSSAHKWLERQKHASVEACYAALRAEGFRVLASRVAEGVPSLYDLDLTVPAALVFGNEHRGVSEEAAEAADGLFVIPMMGMIRSLNVSVACAVTLYEALRQRMRRGFYDAPRLPAGTREALLQEWLRK
ncbi:MAG: RNA methyltransferase [Bacteroidota bacterium]